MNYADLMQCVRERLPTRQAITANYVQSRYHILQMVARKVIQDLQEEGLIGKTWDAVLGGYPVLVEKTKV
jgi:ribosomal protein S25